jgi:hypothetical protein
MIEARKRPSRLATFATGILAAFFSLPAHSQLTSAWELSAAAI